MSGAVNLHSYEKLKSLVGNLSASPLQALPELGRLAHSNSPEASLAVLFLTQPAVLTQLNAIERTCTESSPLATALLRQLGAGHQRSTPVELQVQKTPGEFEFDGGSCHAAWCSKDLANPASRSPLTPRAHNMGIAIPPSPLGSSEWLTVRLANGKQQKVQNSTPSAVPLGQLFERDSSY